MAAQFTADLNPKSNSMSLADMMKVGLYSAETDVLNRQAQVAREKEKELPLVQSWAKSKEVLLPDGSYDLKQLPALIAMAPLTGPDFADKIINLTKNHIDTNKALNALSEENRKPFASIYGNYGQIAANGQPVTGNEIINSLERLKEFYPQLAQAADGQIKGWKARPLDQPVDPQALLKARNESLTPTQLIDQFAPKAEMANIGGADRVVVRKPSIMGEQPTITPSGFGGQPIGGGATTSTTTSPGTTTTSGKMPAIINYGSLKYSGDPELMNLNTAQKEAREIGQKLVVDAPYNLKAAKDIQQPIRKVEEYLNSASGSKLYQTLQAGGKYAWGNADLDTLVKNIAQVQARNAEVMGLAKTDHMQDLNAKLSGSEKIDAKALAGVMQQVKADAIAAEKYNNGLLKFVEKNGDINGQILAKKFQSAWADNYDPRIFQRQNIENSQLSEREKDTRIREIDAGMTKDEFKELENKAKILHRLEKGLYQ
jgi:hypothetical protein